MVYQPRTEEGTPLDSAISEMDVIADDYGNHRDYVELVKGSLQRVRESHLSGELTTDDASFALFNIYFHNQKPSRDLGSMAHILRVVGDDFGIQLGADPDGLWDLYEKSADLHS